MRTNFLIKDLPCGERPRERLMSQGAEALKDSELIAILLRTGPKGASAVQVAEDLLRRFRDLGTLASARVEDLSGVTGVGRDKAIALKSAFTLARRMAKELRPGAPLLDTPERVREYLGMYANARTLDYGPEGREGVRVFLEQTAERGLLPPCTIDWAP